MEPAAALLARSHGVAYTVLPGCAGLAGTDSLLQTVARISGQAGVP